MECFWSVFETLTKVSKENGFHGNLVTKQKKKSIAYIPPERKVPGVGGWRWAVHPTPEFCVTQRKIYQHVGISGVG